MGSFLTDLKQLMPHTIVHRPVMGIADQHGQLTPGTGTSYVALVEKQQKVVRDPQGREQVTETVVYVGAAPGFTPQDEVELPDGTKPPILAVAQLADELGTVSEVLYLGPNRAF